VIVGTTDGGGGWGKEIEVFFDAQPFDRMNGKKGKRFKTV